MSSMAAAATPSVKVYFGTPILPDVSRVLTCLYEKEVDFTCVDLYEGQQMPTDFLKLQASTTVPVIAFEQGMTLLFESRAICRYISEKHSDRGNKYLLGRDLLERTSIEQWLKSEEQSFNPPSWTLVFHLAFAPLTHNNHPDPVLLTQCEQKLARVLDVYDQRLTESTFLTGNHFTLADLSHLPNSHYIANSPEWGYLFDSRKNVRRWFEEISNRPSWQKVVDLLHDVSVELDDDISNEETTTLQVHRSVSSGAQSLKIVHQTATPSRQEKKEFHSDYASPGTQSKDGSSPNQIATPTVPPAPASNEQGKKESHSASASPVIQSKDGSPPNQIATPTAPPASAPNEQGKKESHSASASPVIQSQDGSLPNQTATSTAPSAPNEQGNKESHSASASLGTQSKDGSSPNQTATPTAPPALDDQGKKESYSSSASPGTQSKDGSPPNQTTTPTAPATPNEEGQVVISPNTQVDSENVGNTRSGSPSQPANDESNLKTQDASGLTSGAASTGDASKAT